MSLSPLDIKNQFYEDCARQASKHVQEPEDSIHDEHEHNCGVKDAGLIHYKDLEFFVKKYYGETGDKFNDVFETVDENEHGDIRIEDFKKEFDKVWSYFNDIEILVFETE